MRFTPPSTAIALSLATLVLLPLIYPLIAPSHSTVYHLQGSARVIFIPVFLSLFSLWAVTALMLRAVQTHLAMRTIVWSALIALLPWGLFKVTSIVYSWQTSHRTSLIIFLAGVFAFATLTILWKPAYQPKFDAIQDFVATLLAFASISALIVLGQLGWAAWKTRNLNEPQALHTRTTGSAARPRILWLVFDELSYQQVYEQRFPGLELPAFDRLATQSTVFSHTLPAGLMTEYVIPSLISGLPAEALRASWDGRGIALRDPVRHTWQPFDPHQTVFQDALNRGFSTGLVGWYNPYCRILPSVLDRCNWSNHYARPGDMRTDLTVAQNLRIPLQSLRTAIARYFSPHRTARKIEPQDAIGHVEDYRTLFREADALLDDPSTDFLYLHLPVPHPNGIYNRHTRQFTTGPSTYIDNLALADVYLSHLREKLEARGEWESTTLLLMGDHGWRTAPIWMVGAGWSAEESEASNKGRFDNRPVYLLKLPGQQRPAHIDAPFAAVRTRALLDALMDGHIRTPEDLAAWSAIRP